MHTSQKKNRYTVVKWRDNGMFPAPAISRDTRQQMM
jgi:hypothetical protein